jgi:hypothetical protein
VVNIVYGLLVAWYGLGGGDGEAFIFRACNHFLMLDIIDYLAFQVITSLCIFNIRL